MDRHQFWFRPIIEHDIESISLNCRSWSSMAYSVTHYQGDILSQVLLSRMKCSIRQLVYIEFDNRSLDRDAFRMVVETNQPSPF